MKISTKGRYALRMMIDLAEHNDGSFISLKDIAARQNISKKYLEQIIPILNHAGLLATVRGHQGGYRLAKAPAAYTVGEILRATEGSTAPVACLEGTVNDCPRKGFCKTLPIWQGLQDVIDNYLDGITLAELVEAEKSTK